MSSRALRVRRTSFTPPADDYNLKPGVPVPSASAVATNSWQKKENSLKYQRPKDSSMKSGKKNPTAKGAGWGAVVHPVSQTYELPSSMMYSINANNRIVPKPHNKRDNKLGLMSHLNSLSVRLSNSHYSLKRYLQRVLSTGKTGVFIDWASFLLSLISCATPVWATYALHHQLDPGREDMFVTINLFMCLFLTLEFLLRLFVADSRVTFLSSTDAIIDLITLLPMYMDLAMVVRAENDVLGVTDGLIKSARIGMASFHFSQIIGTLGVFRVLRLRRVCVYVDDEPTRETLRLVLDIFSICFVASGMVYILENSFRPRSDGVQFESIEFHNCFYFTVVTVSTVGYGDVKVMTGLGQLFISLLIIVCVIYIPMSTNKLLKVISESSKYAVRKYKPMVRMRHVIITGHMHADGAREFFKEFFHPDHGDTVDQHVVMLMDKPPSEELRAVLEHTRYEMVVTYLQGTVHSEADLQRARAAQAEACFVLADKFSADSKRADTDCLLKALALKQYFRRVGAPVKMCIQLVRPESRERFLNAESVVNTSPSSDNRAPASAAAILSPVANPIKTGAAALASSAASQVNAASSEPNSIDNQDIAICIDQIKMHLLAKSCLCPGINTIISNLVISSQNKIFACAPPVNGKTAPDDTGKDDWTKEYRRGCDYEIYRTPALSEAFTNVLYKDLVNGIYRETGVLIIGLEIHLKLQDGTTQTRLVLNPVELVVPPVHECTIYALAFAKDETSADLNALFSERGEHKSSILKATGKGSAMYSFGNGVIDRQQGMFEVMEQYRTVPQNTRYTRKQSVKPMLKKHGGGFDDGSMFGTSSSTKHQHHETSSASNSTIVNKNVPASNNDFNQVVSPLKLRVAVLADVIVRTSLAEERPEIRQHIVYTGSVTNLASFVEVLCDPKGGARGSDAWVVVLNEVLPTENEWENVSGKNVIFLEGTALDANDLKRAGVEYARCAVISAWDQKEEFESYMSGEESSRSRGGGRGQNFEVVISGDADAIFAHQGIKKLNPMIDIVTEIVDASNIVFLETKLSRLAASNDIGIANSSPSIRSVATTPDSTFNSSHNAHGDVDAVGSLGEGLAQTGDAGDRRIISGVLASGSVFTVSLLDALICQSYYNPQIINVVEAILCGVDENFPKSKEWIDLLGTCDVSISMHRIAVPKSFCNKSYGELFSYMLVENDITCIALTRGLRSKWGFGHGHAGNCYPYVVTNPDHSCILREEDFVFCFSHDDPKFVLPADIEKSFTNLAAQLTRSGKKKKA